MPRKKVKIKLRRDPYGLISDSVRSSITAGINKYLKYYNDTISNQEYLSETVHNYVMGDLDSLVDWEASK